MSVQDDIENYMAIQPEQKRSDLQALHRLFLQVLPAGKLWYLDGKDADGKIVSNPDIGYGHHTLKYADGKTKEFYQVGMSANKSGLSVYIVGLEDKTYLPRTYADRIGKADVSGYCIKFKALKDIDVAVLESAIRYGVEATSQ